MNIIHRNIRLSSIYIDENGVAKIGSFEKAFVISRLSFVPFDDENNQYSYVPVESYPCAFASKEEKKSHCENGRYDSPFGDIYSLGICFLLLLYPDSDPILVEDKEHSKEDITEFIFDRLNELTDSKEDRIRSRILRIILDMINVWTLRYIPEELLEDEVFVKLGFRKKKKGDKGEKGEKGEKGDKGEKAIDERELIIFGIVERVHLDRLKSFNLNSPFLIVNGIPINPYILDLAVSYWIYVSEYIYTIYGSFQNGKILQIACILVASEVLSFKTPNLLGINPDLIPGDSLVCKLLIIEELGKMNIHNETLSSNISPYYIMSVIRESQLDSNAYINAKNNNHQSMFNIRYEMIMIAKREQKEETKNIYDLSATYFLNEYDPINEFYFDLLTCSPGYVFDAILRELEYLGSSEEQQKTGDKRKKQKSEEKRKRLERELYYVLSRSPTIPSLPYFVWHSGPNGRKRIKMVAEVAPELIIQNIEEISQYGGIENCIYGVARAGYYNFAQKLNSLLSPSSLSSPSSPSSLSSHSSLSSPSSSYSLSLYLGLLRYGDEGSLDKVSNMEPVNQLKAYYKVIASGNVKLRERFESIYMKDNSMLKELLNKDRDGYIRAILRSRNDDYIRKEISERSLNSSFSMQVCKLIFNTLNPNYILLLSSVNNEALFKYSILDYIEDEKLRIPIDGGIKEAVKGLLSAVRVTHNHMAEYINKNNYELLMEMAPSAVYSNQDEIDVSNFFQLFFTLPFSKATLKYSDTGYCIQKVLDWGIRE
jgi:serine/threonine protein kinase